MANGLGAFLSGAVEGYDKGQEQLRKQQEFGLRKQQFELERQAKQLEIDRQKREEAFQQDMRDAAAPLLQEIAASKNPPPPQNGLQAGAQAPAPLDLADISERFADMSIAVGFKHGKVTLDQLKQARDLRKQLDEEGVSDAVRAKLAGASDEEMAKIFNKRGKFKFDPATMRSEVVEDKDGLGLPNVIVYKKNPDGTESEAFNYANIARASVSKDVYTQLEQAARTTKMKEKGDTFRTGMTTQATLAAANAKTDKDLPPEVKAFNTRMDKEFEAIFKGTAFNLNPRDEMVLRGEVSALGRRLIDEGKLTANEAYNQATRAVFQKYKIPVDPTKLK